VLPGGAFAVPAGTMVWLSTAFLIGAIAAGIFIGSLFSIPLEIMVKQEAGQ
jgi:hypothetical protein